MQITFDTTTLTKEEALGLFALLDTVRPDAFDPGPFDTARVEKAVEEKLAGADWTGVQITKRADTDQEVSREPIPIAEDEDDQEAKRLLSLPTIDANGLPWDERIHSGTKALNADGTWRTKRGVDKALVAEVEAELRSQGDDPEELERVEEEVKELLAAPPAPPAPPAPAPTAPTPEPAPVAPSSSTSPFVALMKRVTTAQGAGKLTAQRVKELLESLDKKSIMDLRTDTDALDAFAVLLDGEGV